MAVPEAEFKRGNTMKKLLAILLVCLMLAVQVSANAGYVTDHARLLTSAETQTMEDSFTQYHSEYSFTVAVVTVSSLNGESAAAYASGHYAAAGYDNDGVMLLISERDGLWYVYTSGIGAEVITDEMIGKLGTYIKEDLEAGKYYDACKTFTKRCTNPICERINENAVSNKTLEREHHVFIALGLGGGLLVGIAAVMVLAMYFKHPKKKTEA